MQGNGIPHQNDLPVSAEKRAGMEIESNWGK
jgi:hypothetical protein